jgi:hypothetical protein
VKLFQIEEPEGAPLVADGPGASVGIELASDSAAVAISLGGNAELLPASDGTRRLMVLPAQSLADLLLDLRAQAEKQLARPVTHAVIATEAGQAQPALIAAATQAGIAVLRVVTRTEAGAKAGGGADAAALGAAKLAEDLAPQA